MVGCAIQQHGCENLDWIVGINQYLVSELLPSISGEEIQGHDDAAINVHIPHDSVLFNLELSGDLMYK